MSFLQVPLWIVALILFLVATFRPFRGDIPLGLAFFVTGFLVAAI